MQNNVHDGLVNGVMGVIRRFGWTALRKDQLESGELPLMMFDDASITGNLSGVGGRIQHRQSNLTRCMVRYTYGRAKDTPSDPLSASDGTQVK